MRTISSERLLLRPWTVGDAEFLLDLESRSEVVRFLYGKAAMSTREEALASIARRQALDHPVHGIWVITVAANRRPVGNLLLKPATRSSAQAPAPDEEPREPEVEIGWHLHPAAWGNGYATEAARAVLQDASERGLSRVIAVTHPNNTASQAVCRRLDMTHRGRTTDYYDAVHELYDRQLGVQVRELDRAADGR
ncbi:GNAT family N-acetyltransferase [Nocardioides KLBMP 9356]|uniref:GNAT family N-acetyltransferase n=1 Tax=Nocardioides potassii TaxID=2911371 RepID=A0ABS9HDD1_9ACTN|nr:GNAT family N-acetyltransferase [Nocardioides potassii]MCF6378123.1 GNAT family N-acetyltransferase [Nocardioides potassii]